MGDLEQPIGFWERVKRLFGGRDAALPASHSIVQVRRSIFHPWRRTESEIADLQKNVESLTQVMVSLRDHLEQQSRHQEELGQHLERMSEASDGFPEGARTPDEAVRAIATQMAYQSQQQNRLANILEKISDTTNENGKALHGLIDRMESVEHHSQIIGENVQSMGIVVQSVNRNSEQSTQNVAAVREHAEHQTQLQELVHRQIGRLTILLVSTLIVAIAALITAVVMGMMILHLQRIRPASSHASEIVSMLNPGVALPGYA
jgi:chromosome segregation ATPase